MHRAHDVYPRRRVAHIGVMVVVVFLLAACAPQPFTVTREPVTLRLVAADSCGPLAEELAAVYEDTHPWVTIQVEVFNSSVAERTLRAGEVDLALLSWLQEAADESPLWSHPFARDGVAVIVHPATPFAETGLAHLQEIFRGRVQEWGGMVLTVVSREEGSGTRVVFDGVVMGGHDVAPTGVVMPSSEAVVEYVARTPGGIGYVSALWMRECVADGVRVLPVEGILPTSDALSSGSYPLSRPFYLAATAEPAGEAREFAQWVLGADGQAILGATIQTSEVWAAYWAWKASSIPPTAFWRIQICKPRRSCPILLRRYPVCYLCLFW